MAGPRLSCWTSSQRAPIRSAVTSPCRRSVWSLALEAVERDLAHHGVDHVLDLGHQHESALFGVGTGEELAEGEHFPEYARGLGERKRRRRHQGTVGGRQHLMDTVAELVRERHDVARFALVVEEDVGMRRWHGRMRECAGRLAGTNRRIDPIAGEKMPGDFGHPRRERAVGGKHGRTRLAPADPAGCDFRQRRVSVPMRQTLLAEPAGLERVIAVR